MPIRRRNGRYQVRVSVGGQRRVERTLPPSASRADAQALEARLLRERVDAAVGRGPKRRIVDALDRWEQGEAPRLKSYTKDLRYRIGIVRGWVGDRPLDDIPEVAEQIKVQAGQTDLSVAAVNRVLSVLRRVGNLAVRWGWTDRPLGQRVQLLPGERAREAYLTRAQVRALLDAIDDPEHRDFVQLAALTGMRRSEILRLQPSDLVGGAIVLGSNTKSGRPRIVPLPPQALRIARRRLPWMLTARTLTRRWNAARQAAGLPGVRLHDLRHSYATWLAAAGVPLTGIRDLLGHSSLAVTSRYAHSARPDLVAATRKLRL